MTLVMRPAEVDGEFREYLDLYEEGFTPLTCTRLPADLKRGHISIDRTLQLPDVFYLGMLLVVADTFKTIATDFRINAEFLKLSVTLKGASHNSDDYWYINLLDAVPCFNYQESVYNTSSPSVGGIEQLVLVDNIAQGHDLFILGPIPSDKPSNPKAIGNHIVCASEDFAKQILRSGVTGVAFVLPEHFNSFPVENVAWNPMS